MSGGDRSFAPAPSTFTRLTGEKYLQLSAAIFILAFTVVLILFLNRFSEVLTSQQGLSLSVPDTAP